MLDIVSEIKWDHALQQLLREVTPKYLELEPARVTTARLSAIICDRLAPHYGNTTVNMVGGVAKSTAIRTSEIPLEHNLMVCIGKDNLNSIPPNKTFRDFVGEVREQVVSVLKTAANVEVLNVEPKRRSGMSIQIKADNMNFEICVAIRFHMDPLDQVRLTMARMNILPDPVVYGHYFSPGLDVVHVLFIKKQTEFTRNLIRLAKFWDKHIVLEKPLTGRSALIELIAVKIAQEDELKKAIPTISAAFWQFLLRVQDFNNLNIAWTVCYTLSDVQSEIASERPLVLDPANPYNNLAKIDKANIDKYIAQATQTMEKMKKYEKEDPIYLNYLFNKYEG